MASLTWWGFGEAPGSPAPSMNSLQYGVTARFFGTSVTAGTQNDWRVTVMPNAGTTVLLNPGYFYVHGVTAFLDDFHGVAISSGTSDKWWNIVAEYNWVYKAVDIYADDGDRRNYDYRPGNRFQAVVAAVHTVNGSITEIVDLRSYRTWDSDSQSEDAIYSNDPPVGTRRKFEGVWYEHRLQPDGVTKFWDDQDPLVLDLTDSYEGVLGSSEDFPAPLQGNFTTYDWATFDFRAGINCSGSGRVMLSFYVNNVLRFQVRPPTLASFGAQFSEGKKLKLPPGNHAVKVGCWSLSGSNQTVGQGGWSPRWVQVSRVG